MLLLVVLLAEVLHFSTMNIFEQSKKKIMIKINEKEQLEIYIFVVVVFCIFSCEE